ncbi:MAG: phosphoglycolate phosphatase [Pseudomonadota bacterium]
MSLTRVAPVFPNPVQGVLFDLDGTLIDSVPDIAASLNLALQEAGYRSVAEPKVREWVGNGSGKLVDRALQHLLGQPPQKPVSDTVFAEFLRLYRIHICNKSTLYPGVLSTLETIHRAGLKMGVVTNKPLQHSEALLSRMQILDFFTCVVGGDSLAVRKPDPAPVLHACKTLEVAPKNSVMVGDSRADVVAAQRANCPVICLTYGYNQGQDLESLNPSALIEDFSLIPELIMIHPHRSAQHADQT